MILVFECMIIGRGLITPQTIEQSSYDHFDVLSMLSKAVCTVKSCAEVAQGDWVVVACKEYESNNEAIILARTNQC
jgi:hypothetical protein